MLATRIFHGINKLTIYLIRNGMVICENNNWWLFMNCVRNTVCLCILRINAKAFCSNCIMIPSIVSHLAVTRYTVLSNFLFQHRSLYYFLRYICDEGKLSEHHSTIFSKTFSLDMIELRPSCCSFDI